MKLSLLFLIAALVRGSAQYQLTSWTVDAGGGLSTGSVYAVTGTIGQPDANIHAGGPYTLYGGFWGAFATVSTPGAPSLRIFYTSPNVILAWPNPSTGYQLQSSPSLSAAVWTDVNVPAAIVGNEKQVTQPVNPGTRFYRLRHP